MLLLTHTISSIFSTFPQHNNRHFPTYRLGIVSLSLLGGIFWWHTHHAIFLLIPLIQLLDKNFRFLSMCLFFGMALYCTFLENNHTKLHDEILGYHQKLDVHIHDILHNELKNNYKVTGVVTIPTSGKRASVQIFLKDDPGVRLGDILSFKNLTFQKTAYKKYTNYLIKEGIHATTYSTGANFTCRGHRENLLVRTKKIVHTLEKKIQGLLSARAWILFDSLFLGSKKYAESHESSIKESFNRWGMNHFLARSGLHVTLIVFLFLLLGRIMYIPHLYVSLITSLFLCMYGLFSYTSVSFIRAFISSLLALWCSTFHVPTNPLYLLTITLLISLIYNPFAALFLDFQLTFLLTWGLCILSLLDF